MRGLKTKEAEIEAQENEGKDAEAGKCKKGSSAAFAGIRAWIWGIIAGVLAFLHAQIAAPFSLTVYLAAAAVFMLCALIAAIKYYKRELSDKKVLGFLIFSGAAFLYACVDMVNNRRGKSLLGWIFSAKRDGIEYRLGSSMEGINKCLFYANFAIFCTAALILIASVCKYVRRRKQKNADACEAEETVEELPTPDAAPEAIEAAPAEERSDGETPSEEAPRVEE